MRSTLDPTLDVVFKLLFAAPDSRGTLAALLAAVLRPATPISSVEVLNAEVSKEDIDDKGIALDILVSLADGTKLDVEMQADKRPAFRDRALYYWARVFGARLEPGDSYSTLLPVISILFLDYRELEGTRLHSTFPAPGKYMTTSASTTGLEIHVIELPKLVDLAEADRLSGNRNS